MAQPQYALIIYWSDEDESFIAEVLELPGCVADGHTGEDALSMVQEVMDIRIETQMEMGHLIPEPKERLMSA